MHTHFTLSCQLSELVERLSAILTMKRSRVLSGGQLEDFYFSGINSQPEKCCKYFELGRNYIEK